MFRSINNIVLKKNSIFQQTCAIYKNYVLHSKTTDKKRPFFPVQIHFSTFYETQFVRSTRQLSEVSLDLWFGVVFLNFSHIYIAYSCQSVTRSGSRSLGSVIFLFVLNMQRSMSRARTIAPYIYFYSFVYLFMCFYFNSYGKGLR